MITAIRFTVAPPILRGQILICIGVNETNERLLSAPGANVFFTSCFKRVFVSVIHAVEVYGLNPFIKLPL
jgi:hypothetical protein